MAFNVARTTMTKIIIIIIITMTVIKMMMMMMMSGVQRHESLLDAAHLVAVLPQLVLGMVLLQEAELL